MGGNVFTWSMTKVRVVRYLAVTWIPHKKKFVHAWTNDFARMGNQTTNRVESQHSSFKYYLGIENSSFDTLFKRGLRTNHKSVVKDSTSTVGIHEFYFRVTAILLDETIVLSCINSCL